MSAGAVFRECLRVVDAAGLGEAATRDVLLALEAGRPGTLGLSYEIGHEAGLSREVLLARGAAVYLNFAAGNLADDLADGDAGWLPEAARRGPGLQYLMQNLFVSAVIRGGLDGAGLLEVAGLLAEAAARQQDEVSPGPWTAPRYRAVAEGIFGLQWAAYLRLLGHGTPLQARARALGTALGVATNVARDRASNDRRLLSLPEDDRREVARWALAQAREAGAAGLVWLARAVAPAAEELERLAA